MLRLNSQAPGIRDIIRLDQPTIMPIDHIFHDGPGGHGYCYFYLVLPTTYETSNYCSYYLKNELELYRPACATCHTGWADE